ncbi:MAG TPA: phosphoglycerate kinase, partial [Rickettsiales bacterium]|nr:phosphoglycerate kinase [Rickettsiales bacterium]
RIRAIIPTLQYLAQNKAKVIIISHFGRPKSKFDAKMSLKPLVSRISELLGDKIKVGFIYDSIGEKVVKAVENTNYGDVILLENLRFYKEETQNNEEFARKLASLGNLYVNDAFSCSHRAHASIVGIPAILKHCAGFLLTKELDNLTNLLENAKKPMMAVVGGAKVSTKFDLLHSLVEKADSLVVGGGMANSFLYAIGKNIGKSLCEKELKDGVLKVIAKAKKAGCEIILPIDVVVAKKFVEGESFEVLGVDDVRDDDIILDIAEKSIKNLLQKLQTHKTLVWNGPLGAFEIKPFNIGTESFARNVAQLTKSGKLLSIAGGGDVVSAINSINLADDFTYISTAGGAFLEWLEGKDLPGLEALKK